ncbi:Glycoside hydrolase family 79 protein [Mycena indigotica]|uniref:Glycoside hydrolase family 79 protein n=1 Tax=Mycena indigotica TaxID=2126181 RepID=A0A8H6TFE2_9AGAR|nr:Glycoside hydrolase family 79 protein [Mycena indigotica]KAF7316356.1 Glycoside hydrolase family 79 protein [Mycena indigotica]
MSSKNLDLVSHPRAKPSPKIPSFPMRFLAVSVLIIVGSLHVSACEGPCITNTTEAFRERENSHVDFVMDQIGKNIISALKLPNIAPQTLMKPAMASYQTVSFANLRQSIFPNYFHGKCQNPKTGIDPVGCPNPDCPVVCGTPGSMVHFYDVLVEIVHNSTLNSIAESFDEHSTAFQAILDDVTHLAKEKKPVRRFPVPPVTKSSITSLLKREMAESPALLEKSCGGKQRPACRWKKEMVPFILSFP